MSDNEWAAKAARVICELIDSNFLIVSKPIENPTVERMTEYFASIITHHAVPEFAVMEKAVEMMAMQESRRHGCPYPDDTCGNESIRIPEERGTQICSIGNEQAAECVKKFWIAKAREEVGNE